MKQFIVDAFTGRPFSGNPAAVCLMERWPSDEAMMRLAAENNLSETAFLVREGAGYRLRWFTPATEVTLCGHATLASAFAILTEYEPQNCAVCFETRSGPLTVRRSGSRYEMDFPICEQHEVPVTDEMERAFDQGGLRTLEGRIQNATARGSRADCVSRSFAPKLGIAEDPVCGSAHCQIAPYWAGVLKKPEIIAEQASRRGGTLFCRPRENGCISIGGEAVLVAVSEIAAPLI